MKRLFFAAAALLCAFVLYGQPLLPNDPAVKTGRLDNGMTYYIRHNELPAGRCEFYLATNVGAIQEAPDQDGLAHFLEHMCFNGLKNLPGKQMLDYLQNIGAEFGRNINASTGVEHTQYMLNNIPVSREGIIDTCLLIMHDYSHFVLNEPEEIDAERGVILEEKRTRNTAGWRMFEKSAKYIYGESSKYATCNIIGSEENLRNFKPQSLVDFYRTWYRPDMQAIVVVGDIDVESIYSKIVAVFSDIPAPETPTVKVMPAVEINDEPVVGIITDPENTASNIDFLWKLGEPTPKEARATQAGYVERLVKSIIGGVMEERFADIAAKADAPFLGAYLAFSDISETCEALEGSVTCDNAKVDEACRTFLTEVEKMKRFGFTDEEVARVKDNLIRSRQSRVEGAATRTNDKFVPALISNFFGGYPYLTPETDLQLAEAVLPQLNAAVINQILPQLLAEEHLTVIYTGVDKPGQVHPTGDQVLGIVAGVKASDIQPNAAEAVSGDFMAAHPLKPGKVRKEYAGLYGSTEWILNNGLRVVVLPTEYKKDQVLFQLRKKGGLSLVPTDALDSFDETLLSVYESNRGVAEFSSTTVSKMLSGKIVSISPFINQLYNGVSGSCSPKDVETALQLVNLTCTAPRYDREEWDISVNQLRTVLSNYVNTPDFILNDHMYSTLYDNPRHRNVSLAKIDAASLDTFEKYSRELFSGFNGATLYIVGNVDVQLLKGLVEKYCGSLPKGKGVPAYDIRNAVNMKYAGAKDVFRTKMETPKASVLQVYNANMPYSVQRSVDMQAAEFILDMIYVATLREEEGGTYGASASMRLSYQPWDSGVIQVYFDTNVEQQERLRQIAVDGLRGLAENGPSAEQLLRAQENARKNVPEKRITNSYWMGALVFNTERGGDYDAEYGDAVGQISADGIRDVLGDILVADSFKEIVMLPEE